MRTKPRVAKNALPTITLSWMLGAHGQQMASESESQCGRNMTLVLTVFTARQKEATSQTNLDRKAHLSANLVIQGNTRTIQQDPETMFVGIA